MCFSCLLSVWYSCEIWLALVKESRGAWEQLAAERSVRDGGGRVWGRQPGGGGAVR